eukprot:symbB.v1.2.029258.t1/scaffold3181.1/size61880/1
MFTYGTAKTKRGSKFAVVLDSAMAPKQQQSLDSPPFRDRQSSERTSSSSPPSSDVPPPSSMSVSVCPLPGAASGMSGVSGKRQETAALVQRMNSSGVVVQFLATCMVVEKHWDQKELLALWVYQVSEWMSFFMVTYLAQWTSHLFLVLALVIMYILAVLRAGSFLQPFMRPIYMFLPERHSYFGL